MANNHSLQLIKTQYNAISEINLHVASKNHLGEKSISIEVITIVNDIKDKIDVLLNNLSCVQDGFVIVLSDRVVSIIKKIKEISNTSDPDFLNQREGFLSALNSLYINFLKEWIYIQSGIIDARKLLQKSDVAIEELKENVLKQAQNEFQELKNNTLNEINSSQTNSINLINEREAKLKEKIQNTARKVSVSSAQKQFEEECQRLKSMIKIWSIITIILFVMFGILSYIFYTHTFFTAEMKINSDIFSDKFIDIMRWESIFHTVIRVAVLAIIGTIIAFCLKMMRANFHLYQHNLHRQRVANSIEAFVNAALTDEQSDRILEKLVEAVVSFGQSGLIQNEDDSIHASKLTIDSITKTLYNK